MGVVAISTLSVAYTTIEGTQRVHISAKLHCLHPDRSSKFHLCSESHIVYLYICCNCMVIVAMTTQRYNFASRNSWLLRRSQNIGNSVTFLYIFPQSPPRSWTNLTVSSESQWNIDANDLLSVRKYSQLFTHESNTFLGKQYVIPPIQMSAHTDRQTDRQTDKSANSIHLTWWI